MVWYGLFLFRICIRLLLRFPFDGSGSLFGGGKRAQLDFVGRRKSRSANRRGGASVFAMDLLLGNLFRFFFMGDTYLFTSGVLGISLGVERFY